MTPLDSNVITVRSLTKRYRELTAVNDLSLELRNRECLAILGPNGAGKTTLLEMIEGLQRPDSGSIEIFGQSLSENRAVILRRIGAVLQETNLYKRMTIRETWQLFASFFANSMSVAELAAKVGLTEQLDKQLRHLSGGERQRAYLGTAMIGRPEILFLDEPTTGLDPHARRKLWALIQELQATGISMILTTHYMEEAAHLAQRVVIMHKGRIVVGGDPRELVRTHCGSDVVEVNARDSEEFLRAVAERFAKKYSLQSEMGVLNIFCNSLDEAVALAKLVAEFGASRAALIQSLQVRRATLEDVFILKTGSTFNASN
jgi:ABC-2 type transport system ATP-binding protein